MPDDPELPDWWYAEDAPPPVVTVPPPRARTTDPETSHMAAASMAGDASETQRAAVVRSLQQRGPTTADGLWVRLGYDVHRRVSELVEMGVVVWTGTLERTRSERMARVYCAP